MVPPVWHRPTTRSVAASSDWDYDVVAANSEWDMESLFQAKSTPPLPHKRSYNNAKTTLDTDQVDSFSFSDDDSNGSEGCYTNSHVSYIEDDIEYLNLKNKERRKLVSEWNQRMGQVKTSSSIPRPRKNNNSTTCARPILLTPLEMSIVEPRTRPKEGPPSVCSSNGVSSLGTTSLISAYTARSGATSAGGSRSHTKKRGTTTKKNGRSLPGKKNIIFGLSARGLDSSTKTDQDLDTPVTISSQEELEKADEQLKWETCPTQEELARRYDQMLREQEEQHQRTKQQRIHARESRRRGGKNIGKQYTVHDEKKSSFLSKSSSAALGIVADDDCGHDCDMALFGKSNSNKHPRMASHRLQIRCGVSIISSSGRSRRHKWRADMQQKEGLLMVGSYTKGKNKKSDHHSMQKNQANFLSKLLAFLLQWRGGRYYKSSSFGSVTACDVESYDDSTYYLRQATKTAAAAAPALPEKNGDRKDGARCSSR